MTDLDNTLYNWVDFFAPSFRGTLHALHRETQIPEEVLVAEFRAVFQEKGSLEYPAQANELPSLAALPQVDLVRLNAIMFGAFNLVSRARLQLYDGAVDCLRWCMTHDVPVVALTNAPLTLARRRLTQLGVNEYFAGLAGPNPFGKQPTSTPSSEPLLFDEADLAEPGRRLDSRFNVVYALDRAEMKPHAGGFRRIMADLGKRRSLAFAIGDSPMKDLAPAHDLGAITIWAQFGTHTEQRNLQTLFGITPWTAMEIEFAGSTAYTADHCVTHWAQVTELLGDALGIPVGRSAND